MTAQTDVDAKRAAVQVMCKTGIHLDTAAKAFEVA